MSVELRLRTQCRESIRGSQVIKLTEMETFEFHVYWRYDADEICEILRPLAPTGIQFTRRRAWFLWAKFIVVGPAAGVARARRTVEQWQIDKQWDNF